MTSVTMFSTKPYDRRYFDEADVCSVFDIGYLDTRLGPQTVSLASGSDAICAFVNDDLSAPVLEKLAAGGTHLVALRCAGFNNVDLDAAGRLGITVVRVPAYSPNAVAEHTIALMLALNRRIHRAHNRVRDGNFSLDGLVGFDMAGKTASVIGTGNIGTIVARLLWHLRCNVLAVDPVENEHLVELGVRYVSLDDALSNGDIVTLNCPLTEQTRHLIDAGSVGKMKRGSMLVNTGRGALIETQAVLDGLKSGHIGSLALDVYEEEGELFFEDRSDEILTDDVFSRLQTLPNVLITAHQAFLTNEALAAIADTTLSNIADVLGGRGCANVVGKPLDERVENRKTTEHAATMEEAVEAEPEELSRVESLDVAECWALLRTQQIGRLAVPVGDGGVDIFPVNFLVDGGTVVFRTAVGTKLTAVTAAKQVAFEADGHDPVEDMVWSVVVKGRAHAIVRHDEMLEIFDLDVHSWQTGRKPTFVRLEPTSVTGRRFAVDQTDTEES